MTIKYQVTYIETNHSGFSLFNFFRSRERIKCRRCRNYAVMTISNLEDETNKVDLCIECYNLYSIEQLLEEQKRGGKPRMI